MICHKCGKVVLWERIIVDKGTEKRVYHIQCWDKCGLELTQEICIASCH